MKRAKNSNLATHPTGTPAAVSAAAIGAATTGVVVSRGPGSPNRLLFLAGTGTGAG